MRGDAVEILPTCVPQSAADLEACAQAIHPFSSEIHIDIVDGVFAPSRTWPYVENGTFGAFDLSGAAEFVKEVHLMVQDPRSIGIECAKAGAFRILGHVEAFSSEDEAHGTLDAWKKSGAHEVGLGILMDTPFEVLEHHVFIMDVVHFMSISTIGKQGIPYNPDAPARIAAFHEKHPDILISVDGGVAESNIADLVRAGARRFGVGSAISKAADPAEAFMRLKSLAENATL